MACRAAREGFDMTLKRALVQITTIAVVAIVAPVALRAQQAKEKPIDAAQVIAAIDHGVAFLKREQLPRGNWAEFGQYDCGVTSLCTLSLLNSGLTVDDPSVQKAVAYLRGVELDKTYSVSLQTMVLCAAEPKRDMLL